MNNSVSSDGEPMGKTDFVPRSHSAQANAVVYSPGDGGKAARVMGSIGLGIQKHVVKAVQRLFPDIFSPEIILLSGVAVYLMVTGKMTAKKDDVLRWIGYRNSVKMKKAYRWLESLADKGYLLRVRNNVGSIDRRGYGFALSERGAEVMKAVDRETRKAEQWLRANQDKKRLDDCILYLDQAHKVLRKSQEIMMTPELAERLRGIKV